MDVIHSPILKHEKLKFYMLDEVVKKISALQLYWFVFLKEILNTVE